MSYWDSRKIGFLDRLLQVEVRRRRQEETVEAQTKEFNATFQRTITVATEALLQRHPRRKPTSRKLAAIIGIPESTLRFIRKAADHHPQSAIASLPRLRCALAKLQPSNPQLT